MKIQGNTYIQLKHAIRKTHDEMRNVGVGIDARNSDERIMWDVFHRAGKFGVYNLYNDDSINDAHINTALLKIGKELNII